MYLAKIGAIAGAYYLAAKVGLDLAFATASVTAIWPPTGIALAALIIWGPKVWPGVALGALLANAWTGVPVVTVLGIVVGNTLEGVVGACLLHRVAGFEPALRRVRDVFALVALAAVGSTAIAATIGVTSLVIGDAVALEDFGSVWRVWWLGDMGGALLVAPLLLVVAAGRPLREVPGRTAEAVALAVAVVLLGLFVFHRDTNLAYLAFPLLIWAALRYWQLGATAASLTVAAIAVYFTANGDGPFVRSNPDDSLLLAQTYFGVTALTVLLLAAVITERRDAEATVADIATVLQDSLLPARLPEIPGVELAARFRAVGASYRVGGDFYDVFESGRGRWVLAIGDVCGKGPRAAAVTGLVRHSLRMAALHDDSPGHVLAMVSGALRDALSPREFCTVACARLDRSDSGFALRLASGGHPLPLLARPDGTVVEVGRHGLVLGAGIDPRHEETHARLRSGECLLFYTDGLLDAAAPGRPFAHEELTSLLRARAGASADEIAESVYRTVLEFSPSEPRDDIALVVVRITDEV